MVLGIFGENGPGTVQFVYLLHQRAPTIHMEESLLLFVYLLLDDLGYMCKAQLLSSRPLDLKLFSAVPSCLSLDVKKEFSYFLLFLV
jgi:hypothetical protein